jgi:hypothetical protein
LPDTPVDLLVTHCEVSPRHGTGLLLQRLFRNAAPMVSVRAVDLYQGEQDFGVHSLRLRHETAPWPAVFGDVLTALAGFSVRRIICVPYSPSEVRTALAAQALSGAPRCTWVMDDRNIEADGLPDELLRRLFDRSDLLLAISPEMQRAYAAKFDPRFALAPPGVSPAFLQQVAGSPDAGRVARREGVIFGNIWGERWLADLVRTLDGTGLALDWYSANGTPWMRIDGDVLQRAGIAVRPPVPESELVDALRASPFVIVPTGTFEGDDSHSFVAKLSLPSRLPYLAATAGTPVVIVGHPETAAARFVLRHDLGVVVPYRREALRAAVDALCQPDAQERYRSAAAALAPSLSAEGMVDWIWQSLEAGGPVDRRFERLETRE